MCYTDIVEEREQEVTASAEASGFYVNQHLSLIGMLLFPGGASCPDMAE